MDDCLIGKNPIVFFYRTRRSLCVFKQSKAIKGQSVRFIQGKVGGALSPLSLLWYGSQDRASIVFDCRMAG